jgi:uncharacterized membrane protein
MSRLTKLTLTEAKLFWRDPTGWFFALAFPPLLLVILGSVPAFREPDAELGGLRVIDLYVPILVGFVLATNRQAAARLFVSEATVKTHLLHIYEKLGVRDRAAAVAEAYRRRLLT